MNPRPADLHLKVSPQEQAIGQSRITKTLKIRKKGNTECIKYELQ